MTTTRWMAAVAAALALAFLTLPAAPGITALSFAPPRPDAAPALSGDFRSTAGRAPSFAALERGAAQEGRCDADAKPAPLDFTLRDVNGGQVNLAALKGNVILLNFWATWCGPCKIEIPWFVEFQRRYKDAGLVVLGLSVDDTPEQIRPFAAQFQVNYPMLVGLGREDFLEAYGPVWGLPVTFFIDRDGMLCRTHMGIATREEFQRDLDALL